MENNEKEKRNLMETIKILLQATEELKAYVPRLAKNQKKIFELIESQEEAIKFLMEKMLGTKKDHEERLKQLEPSTGSEYLIEKIDSHEKSIVDLQKKIARLELVELRKISSKLDKEKEITPHDLNVINGFIKEYPENEDLYTLMVHVLEKAGKPEELLSFLELATKKFPKSAYLWYERATASRDKVTFEKNLEIFNKALENLPKDDPLLSHLIYFSRGSLFFDNKKLEKALEDVTKSIEAKTDCFEAWRSKGLTLLNLNRLPEALGCVETGLKLNDADSELWNLKGVILAGLGPEHTKEALESYDKAIECDPKRMLPYRNKGQLLTEEDRYEESLKVLDDALSINKNDTCLLCQKGINLNFLGRIKEAIEFYERALALGVPKDCGTIYANLLMSYSVMKLSDKFLELYEKVRNNTSIWDNVSIKTRARVLNSFAWLSFVKTKRFDVGLKAAKKAVELKPDDPYFLDTLACNLQALGEDDEAVKVFEKAIGLRKSDVEISWEVVGNLFLRLEKPQKAEEAFQKAKLLKEKKSKKKRKSD